MNHQTQRALTYLQRQAALPLPGPERAATLAAAMLLGTYLARARRSLHLRPVASPAAGAAVDGGCGEHDNGACCATPPFSARTVARVRPSGEGTRGL